MAPVAERHILAATLAFVFIYAVFPVQARMWTNAEGKTLEAELVRVKDGRVFLKLAKNRQIHPFEITKLSEADQAFIEEYKQGLAEKLKAEARKERKAKWHEDFESAKAEAEELDLPILFLYTAPEWCGYCVKLEDRVFKSRDFKEFANKNLVLLVADFSQKNDKEEWLEENTQISSKYKAGGYPTMFFITNDAGKLGVLGGFESEWSIEIYIEKIKEIIGK